MSKPDNPQDDCARWNIPHIDARHPVVGSGANTSAPAQPGYEEGFARGREQALVAGRQELQARVAVLQQLMQSLSEPFASLDEVVETELLELSMAIARQVVRRELATDPATVLSVIREAIQLLPVASRTTTLQLHPEDARLVREHLPAPIEEGKWRIVEDASCTRGGCVVTAGQSRIDASLEQQIARISEVVLGVANDADTLS